MLGYLRNGECYSFQTSIVFSIPDNLLVQISGIYEQQIATFSANMLWGIRNGEWYSFQICAIVFSTPENLLVKISGALWTTEATFFETAANVFWENAVGYLRNGECYSFQTCAIVFSIPENLLVKISGALWTTESHFPS